MVYSPFKKSDEKPEQNEQGDDAETKIHRRNGQLGSPGKLEVPFPPAPRFGPKKPDPVPVRLLFYLFGVSCLNLATFGFQEVCLNVPGRLIQHYINHSIIYDFGMYVDHLQLSGLWGAIIAMMPIGAVVGALLAPSLADRRGRRETLFLVAPIISVVGGVLMYVSHYHRLFELLVIGRLVSGVAIGITTTTLPTYLIECTPNHVRGLTCSFQSIGIHLMMTLSFVLSLPMFLGTKEHWGLLLGIQAVPSLITLLLYPLLVETPCYLYTKKQDRSKAINTLIQLCGEMDEKRIDHMLMTYESEMQELSQTLRFTDVFRDEGLCRAASLSMLIGAMRSVSGSPVIHSYSTALFLDVGVPETVAEYGSLVMGFGVVFSLLSSQLVDRIGRRPLYLVTMGLIICNWVFVYICQTFQGRTWSAWASLVSILVSFVVIYPTGPGALSWYLAAELVPVSARATMAGLSIMTLWVVMLLSVSLFPVLRNSIGESMTTMVQFLIPTFIGWVVLLFTLPETRQQPPEVTLRSLSQMDISDEHPKQTRSRSLSRASSKPSISYGTVD